MQESGYDIIFFPLVLGVIHIPLVYLIWIYKIAFVKRRLLVFSKFYNMILFASIIGIMISIAQIKEIMPIVSEKSLNFLEWAPLLVDGCFFHPIFCIVLFFLFLGIFLFAYKDKYHYEMEEHLFSFNFMLYLIASNILNLIILIPSMETWRNSLPYELLFNILPPPLGGLIFILSLFFIPYILVILLNNFKEKYDEFHRMYCRFVESIEEEEEREDLPISKRYIIFPDKKGKQG